MRLPFIIIIIIIIIRIRIISLFNKTD